MSEEDNVHMVNVYRWDNCYKAPLYAGIFLEAEIAGLRVDSRRLCREFFFPQVLRFLLWKRVCLHHVVRMDG